MITQESLLQEETFKINSLEDSYNAKIANLKASLKESIDSKCMQYALSHDQQETDLLRIRLELAAKIKVEKLEDKYSKKISKRRASLPSKIKSEVKNAKRVWEIDILRGLAIWGMMIDHFIWDFTKSAGGIFSLIFKNTDEGFLYSMQQFANAYWSADIRVFIRLFGVFLFVFLSGVSCKFSKGNIKRGCGILGLGLVITGGSALLGLVGIQVPVMISTMTAIGISLIVYSSISVLCKKLFGKRNWKWICLGFFIVLAVFWGILSSINYLNLGHNSTRLWSRFFFVFNNYGNDIGWMNNWSDLNASNWWMPVLGLKGFGSDWLGLFPYIPYVFLGGFVGETLYADKKSIIKYFYHKEDRKLEGDAYLASTQGQMNAKINKKLSGIAYPGRHTLFVYIFHQPAFLLFMIPIILLMGYPLAI